MLLFSGQPVYATAIAAGAPKALHIEPRAEAVVDFGVESFEVVLGAAIDVIFVVVVSKGMVDLAAHCDRA